MTGVGRRWVAVGVDVIVGVSEGFTSARIDGVVHGLNGGKKVGGTRMDGGQR